jgi:hypothetical protein
MANVSLRAYTVQYHGTSGRWYYHVDGIKTTLPEAVLLTRRLERDGYGARLFPSTFTPPDTTEGPRLPRGWSVVNDDMPVEEWTVEEILAREG